MQLGSQKICDIQYASCCLTPNPELWQSPVAVVLPNGRPRIRSIAYSGAPIWRFTKPSMPAGIGSLLLTAIRYPKVTRNGAALRGAVVRAEIRTFGKLLVRVVAQ